MRTYEEGRGGEVQKNFRARESSMDKKFMHAN